MATADIVPLYCSATEVLAKLTKMVERGEVREFCAVVQHAKEPGSYEVVCTDKWLLRDLLMSKFMLGEIARETYHDGDDS